MLSLILQPQLQVMFILITSSVFVKLIKHNQNYYLKLDVTTCIRGLHQKKLILSSSSSWQSSILLDATVMLSYSWGHSSVCHTQVNCIRCGRYSGFFEAVFGMAVLMISPARRDLQYILRGIMVLVA